MPKNNWDYLLRSNQNLKRELKFYCKKYNCTIHDLIIQLIMIGLEQLTKENLYDKVSQTKKFLEKEKESDNNETRNDHNETRKYNL